MRSVNVDMKWASLKEKMQTVHLWFSHYNWNVYSPDQCRLLEINAWSPDSATGKNTFQPVLGKWARCYHFQYMYYHMGRCRAPLTAVFRRPYEGQHNHLSAFDVLASWGEVACPRSLQTAIAVLRIKPRSPESMPVVTAFRKYHNCIMLQLLEIALSPEQHHSMKERCLLDISYPAEDKETYIITVAWNIRFESQHVFVCFYKIYTCACLNL